MCLFRFAAHSEPVPQGPQYLDATYGGETVTLRNAAMRIDFHKRLTGWGWAEIFDGGGKLMAVLDHLGEADPIAAGRVFPLRLEAQEYRTEKGTFGQRITFPVRMQWYDALRDTRWAESPYKTPQIEGTVALTLAPDAARAKLEYNLRPIKTLRVRYVRGPWIKVGAGGFGAAKTDGILPGVDWTYGKEWSSGTDFMQHPQALRVAPHPFKVTAPVMAISHEGTGIGLAWNPLDEVVGRSRYLQPVYASPNFVDRADNHLMGLALPSGAWGVEENRLPIHTLEEKPSLELKPDAPIHIEAEVFLVKGNSADVVTDWVKRHGLPVPPEPRYPLREALDRIAREYDKNLWHEGRGWGRTAEQANPNPPEFLERYARDGQDRSTAQSLREKLAWAQKQPGYKPGARAGLRRFAMWNKEARLSYGRQLLSYQKPDGSFPYDPEGRHKNDLIRIAASLHKPLGRPGDTGLGLTMQPAAELLLLADVTGEQAFRDAARKALNLFLTKERPDGGDWWETPLRSANLLAAGDGAIAYYLGYKAFGEPRYLNKAIYWLRTLLVFTHVWQPQEVASLYDTKPCLNQTMYYGSSWVDNHVQWEVLRVFSQSAELGIEWGGIDREIDWNRYHRGVTVAVLRWMVDHNDTSHRATPPAPDAERAAKGELDTFFYDVHDAVRDTYKGALIDPQAIAANLYALLDRGAK